MPSVKSTLTRRTGLTTVNLLEKYAEMSSPRDAISAISSALGVLLDVLGIALLLLIGSLPPGDQPVIFTFRILSDLKDDGTQAAAAPSNCAMLFRVIAFLVNQVRLIEDLLRLFQADAMLPFDFFALFPIEVESHGRVYNCYTTTSEEDRQLAVASELFDRAGFWFLSP
jgi:hypothetical protein